MSHDPPEKPYTITKQCLTWDGEESPLQLPLPLNPILRLQNSWLQNSWLQLILQCRPCSSCDRIYGSCKISLTLKAPVDIWAHFPRQNGWCFSTWLACEKKWSNLDHLPPTLETAVLLPRTESRIQCWFCREFVKLLLWGRREEGSRRLFLRVTRIVYLARKRFTLNTFPRQCS